MSLTLHKEAYTVDSLNLYRVTAIVDGKNTGFMIQCPQIRTNTEIEILVVARLTAKDYSAEELATITWE